MYVEFRVRTVFLLALVVLLGLNPYGSLPAAAMTSPGGLEAALLQPTPEPPSAPPSAPPSGSGADEGQSQDPYQDPSESPSDPDTSPSNEDNEDAEPVPVMPSYAPTQAEPLPDPSGGEGGWGITGGDANRVYAMPASTGLTISVDRGCGATYTEGESIGFSVTGDWGVDNLNTDWWRYLEVWGSTNGAWWHQVIRGRWVEPRESVYQSAWIAAPVGDELLYARFLDQYGTVLAEASCYYTSEEEYYPPADSWIECGETLSGYVGAGQEEHWSFPGSSGRRVTISMYGDNGFDTFLELRDPNDDFLREHDDISSYNKDSRIRLTLRRNGTYTIVARGYDYQEGSYSLSISCR